MSSSLFYLFYLGFDLIFSKISCFLILCFLPFGLDSFFIFRTMIIIFTLWRLKMRKVISFLVIGSMYLSGQSFCMTPADGEGSKKAFQKTFVGSKTKMQSVQDQRAHSRKSRRAKRVSRIAKRNKRIGSAALIAGGAAAAYYAAPQAKNLVETLGTKLGLNEKPVSVVADPSFWARSLNTVTAHPWISTVTVAGVVGIPVITVAVKALVNKRNHIGDGTDSDDEKPSLVKRLAKGTVSGARKAVVLPLKGVSKVAGGVYSGALKVKGLFSRNRNETIQKLQGDYNTLQRKNNMLQIKNNQLEQEKEDLQKSYDNLKNSDLNASLDEANKKVQNLQNQVNQLETKNQELKDQITANGEKIKQLQDENQEIQNLQNQVNQLEADKQKLEKLITGNDEKVKRLENEKQKLEKQIIDNAGKIKQLEAKNKQLSENQMKPIEGANVSTNSNGTNVLPE